MTPTPDSAEAVNAKIAVLCGWKNIHRRNKRGARSETGKTPWGIGSNGEWAVIQQQDTKFCPVPNYSGSLDAMHEAEKTLTGSHEAPPTLEASAYYQELIAVCYPKLAIFATSAQRAKAFLTTKTRTNS